MSSRCLSFRVVFLCLGLLVVGVAHADAAPPEFRLRYDAAVTKQPFTGRVYVMLSKNSVTQLPVGPNWFKPEPFFAVDVVNWKNGEETVISAKSLGHPHRLDQLPKGTYWAFAVMDFNRGERSFVKGDGNGYSKPVKITVDPDKGEPVSLTIDQIYRPKTFPETERVKLVRVESKLLSEFHKQPVHMNAGVVLPKSYSEQPNKRYPVLYVIPGFGGSHWSAITAAARNPNEIGGVEMVYVVLDPGCRWGHHVFADSDNNGPCGQALCEELIPYIEKNYRCLGVPTARFLTGHSSGGWSSLWLQVTYPDFFGGTWSTTPDPVDFRDFQRVNIYSTKNNVYYDAKKTLRPLARRGDKILLYYKGFCDMEEVMGHGGQLRSFEAVFSPKGADGQPKRLWDRTTGDIDPQVARAWERYDIRLVLERNWPKLGTKLAGKLHVYMGAMDNFYLEGATLLLKKSLAQLGSDAVIELFPNRDHSTLMTAALRQRIAREMAQQFRRHHPAE